MKKVRKALRATDALLAIARARYTRLHEGAVKAHKNAKKAGRRADRLRKQKHPRKAARQDARAQRYGTKATRLHDKSQTTVAQIKRLEQKRSKIKAKLPQGIKIDGNTVTGGTPRERLHACAEAAAAACASGKRPNFYSQSGPWDVDHAITGEAYGHRSDCSSFVTAVYKSCGLDDPNGNDYRGGYTGTLGSNGKAVSSLKPGDLILYGTAPFHHVEMYVGPGDRTIGHGSAPVDAGVVNLVSGPKQFRSYV